MLIKRSHGVILIVIVVTRTCTWFHIDCRCGVTRACTSCHTDCHCGHKNLYVVSY